MGTRFETRHVTDAATMAQAVAQQIQELSVIGGSGRLAIALAGGNTPKRLYETLAQPPFRESVHWNQVELFFGDERAVPPDHPDSNYRMADAALLAHVPVTAHRMRAESGDADAYEKLLRQRIAARRDGLPVFDLVLLGMGKDGHTASLFPGTKALQETTRWVVMNEVPQMQTRRMTLTYPVLNAARRVWLLICGADKREIVARCLAARGTPGGAKQWPVLGVQPTDGELIWWLDDAAASS